MASYKAIAAVGQTIVEILNAAHQAEKLTRPGTWELTDATFALFEAADFAKASEKLPNKKGASVYLYRVGVNANTRNLPPRKGDAGKSFYPSLPLDLYFLVTPWADIAETQYHVLGWVMRTLENIHHMPAVLLNESMNNENVFFPEESVELIFDPLPLSDMSILWENLKTEKTLPSVTYVVRRVLIDSMIEFLVGRPVQTRDLNMGKLIDETLSA